jgi:tetratricopeptide (TPR) repeat protein
MRTGKRAFSNLIEVLLKKKPSENGKQVFSEQCRHYYADNPTTLNMIDEFHQTYESQKAVWWYTRNTFLYFLLNKSLRQQNIEMIMSLHFFLYDLHHQLSVTYEGTNPRTTIEKYYRGQIMTLAEIRTLQERGTAYGSITLNSFLSTTKDYQMALVFAGSGSYDRDNELQSVIFIIELLPSKFNSMDKEYADITQLSACPSEQETLFTVASLLYLEGFEYSESEKTWFIKLTNWSMSDCCSYGRNTDEMQTQTSNSIDMEFIYVGRLLSESTVNYNLFDIYDEEHKNDPPVTKESFKIVKKIYYDVLLQNLIVNQFVYDVGVGLLAFMSGQIDIAAEYLLKALPSENQIYSSDNNSILLLLYDTLGNVYRETCEYELALSYYSASVDISSTEEGLINLACIYKILGHYDHALALSSSYVPIARACDKRKDSVSNLKEWKLFVDYTAMDERYLSKYHLEIIKEYLEIGKVNAGISSEAYLHNYGDYRLKRNEIPVFANDIAINHTRLQAAMDSFRRVIDLCHQFQFDSNSPHIVSANEYMAQISFKISGYSIWKDWK